MTSTNTPSPANQLVGKELPNGWRVEELVSRPENATGGQFSTSYIVRSSNGVGAFLKAMDYTRALKSRDPARELQALTEAFNFERDILEKCKQRSLSRIVRVLDSGKLPAQEGDPSSVVQYLIFELAEGDLRAFAHYGKDFETAWVLRNMHQAAAALQQLHHAGIAHQDIKPSNVLIFQSSHSKLADLGRASDRHNSPSPHDEFNCAGDQTYAPPELLYGDVPENWRARRLGCDMYLLGSLFVFLCTGVSMTHLLLNRLYEEHCYENWGDTYEDVLPYLQKVYTQIMRELRKGIRTELAEEIVNLMKQLCDPDPNRRGHPKNIESSGNQYSLERYVSIFDRLAQYAQWSLRGPIRQSN